MITLNSSTLSIINPRPLDSNKSDFGRVLIIGGSKNFGGAAILAASASIYSGAGLVTVATSPTIFSAINTKIPEAMTINYNDLNELINSIKKANVILIGPGLETNNSIKILETTLKNLIESQTLIVDASAINLLANKKELLSRLPTQTIITPHQMEWQRLSDIDIENQTDAAALDFLNTINFKGILILKSHQTKIYFQNEIYQNIEGNPGMSTGGTGDTLAGIVASFIAQFGYSIESTNAAIYMHSDLANSIFNKRYVVIPEYLIKKIPKYMKKTSEL